MSTFHWDVTLLCTFLYAAPFLWVTSSQFRVFCEGQKMRPKIPEVLHHRGTPNMNFFTVYLGFRPVRKKSTGIESWVGHTSCMTWNEIWICHMYQRIRFFRKVARWLHQQVLPDIDHRVFALLLPVLGACCHWARHHSFPPSQCTGAAKLILAVDPTAKIPNFFTGQLQSAVVNDDSKKRWLADAAIFQDQAMKVVEFWSCLRFFPPFKFNGNRKRVKFFNACLQNNHEYPWIYNLLETWKAWFFPLMSQKGFMVQLDSNTWGVLI